LRKANETEATATARVAILHDDRFLNGTELFELGAESGVIRVPCQATNE
jgi:hypothetical protein